MIYRWPSLRPFNIGGDDAPYLQRWFILPRNNVFCVYLHRMLRDDDDRALHDHPSFNVSVILVGGYVERRFAWHPLPGVPLPPVVARRRWPGQVIFRRAATAHRLSLPEGATRSWSLFVVFRKWRNWGFWCPKGRWVPWQEFTTGPGGALVGKGCG